MKKNILIVTGIFPPDIGGPASFVHALASYLYHRGWQVRVLTLSDDPDYVDEFPFAVSRLKRNLFLPLRILRFSQLVKKLAAKADIVFCNALYFETALRLSKNKTFICKIVGDQVYDRYALKQKKQAVSLQDFQNLKLIGPNRWDQKLRTWALNRADQLISPSYFFKNIISQFVSPKKEIKIIPNANKIILFNSQVAKNSHQMIMICRLIPAKNIPLAMELLSQLPKTYTLKIIGDGPQEQELIQLAKDDDIQNRVSFLGRLDRQEAMTVLQSSEIFLMLSDYENFPHTVLEAFACQTLVIANAVGGIPEMVVHQENGILLKSHSLSELQDVVLNLTTESKNKMVANALENSKDYHPDKIYSLYENLFLQAVKEK